MRIVFLGDVNGRAGRHVLMTQLPRLIARRGIDFVAANVENAADGFGESHELGTVAVRIAAAGVTRSGEVAST